MGLDVFQLCFIPLLRLSCCKMGVRPGLDFTSPKMASCHHKNDDFFEKGECYGRALLPSIICLGRSRITWRYTFNLWQLRQRVDSLAQWVEHWNFHPDRLGSNPTIGGIFFSAMLYFLCYQGNISTIGHLGSRGGGGGEHIFIATFMKHIQFFI